MGRRGHARAVPAIRRRLLLALAPALLVVTAGRTSAYADAPAGPSEGDARAVLQAGLTSGIVILDHSGNAQASPAGIAVSTTGARITPLRSAEYCVEGWHVISVGAIGPADAPRRQLYQQLSSLTIRYLLDGVELKTVRTPIKEFAAGLDGLPAIQLTVGALLPPGSLTVGTHTLLTVFSGGGDPDEQVQVEVTGLDCS